MGISYFYYLTKVLYQHRTIFFVVQEKKYIEYIYGFKVTLLSTNYSNNQSPDSAGSLISSDASAKVCMIWNYNCSSSAQIELWKTLQNVKLSRLVFIECTSELPETSNLLCFSIDDGSIFYELSFYNNKKPYDCDAWNCSYVLTNCYFSSDKYRLGQSVTPNICQLGITANPVSCGKFNSECLKQPQTLFAIQVNKLSKIVGLTLISRQHS